MTIDEDLVRGYWERCWNARELDHLDAVFHEPYVHNRLERTPRDHAEIITDTVASFPDLQVSIDDIRTVGDAVVTRCRFIGTHDGMVFGIRARVVTSLLRRWMCSSFATERSNGCGI